MRRRRVLSFLSGSALGALAGCGSESTVESETTQASRTTAFPREPDDPGANLQTSRGLRVENRSGGRWFVTVSVASGDRLVFAETFEMTAAGLDRVVGRQAVVARSGTYRVEVEAIPADSGEPVRGAFDWRVVGALGDLRVLVGAELAFWQTAQCGPVCEPVSTGGESDELPFDPRDREGLPQYVGEVLVANPTRKTREVRLRVAHEGRPFLAYGYAVPPRVRLRVPAVAWPGAYTVKATSAGETRTYDWGDAVLYTVSLRLGPDGPTFGCGESAGRVILVNATGGERAFAVQVLRDGEAVSSAEVRVPAGEDRQVATGVTAMGRYTLRVEADGESVERAWGPCAPATVTLAEDGQLRIIGGREEPSPALTGAR